MLTTATGIGQPALLVAPPVPTLAEAVHNADDMETFFLLLFSNTTYSIFVIWQSYFYRKHVFTTCHSMF